MRQPWPSASVKHIAALLAHVSATPATPDEAAAAFDGAKPALVLLTDPFTVPGILRHLGLPACPPPLTPACSPPRVEPA